jgi:glutamine phosphoribosylpyrophosphate amidotransferase
MCGIVGILSYGHLGAPIEAETLCAMRDSMRHRGPDDAGLFLSPNGTLGLAHRRLSILDLSVRSANCLMSAGLKTIGDLVTKQEDEIISYKNFGKRSLQEIKDKLAELGLSLGMTAGAKHD